MSCKSDALETFKVLSKLQLSAFTDDKLRKRVKAQEKEQIKVFVRS